MSKAKTYYQIKKKQSKGVIYIYGDIVSDKWSDTDVTASEFKRDLESLGNVHEIDVHINSAGGNVFEGHAIYNMLKMHRAKINVYIDALAASIASVIAMSGDTIFMHKNSFMMIHNSWIMAIGNAKELRDTAILLEKTDEASNSAYLDKSNKLTEEELNKLLEAETWLTAVEAVDKGLADEILEPNEIAASISENSKKLFKYVPEKVNKDLEKITNVEDIQCQNLVETPKKSISDEEIKEREAIKQRAETLKLII
ncbi:head maturation protease, ClpP-related [Staphylococcus xylosus]|uniref:head maturation protease, ClpP-related n=1 Tax=Staphylococcus xylosus TaxID=1288 RepID=UPI000D1D428F|nr:head maturation protease, ClpP-related [Staphylococcus xylosus]PTI64202.1 Clp protease ClpP [Staphylococcus xylosus]